MIKPYYEKDGITIFNGDCEKVMNQFDLNCFDITVSSPPYNTIQSTKPSGFFKEHNHKQNAGYDGYEDNLEEVDYVKWINRVFSRCAELSEGLVWVNHKTRYRDKKGLHPVRMLNLNFYSEIIWNRKGSVTMNAKKFAPSHEFIYGFGEPHFWNNDVNTYMSVWDIMPERDVKGHPCPFPVSIPSRLINASCPEGGVVFDPFSGAGSTLIAARNEGRKAVGIELNSKYCDLAINRLSQRNLF